MNLQANYDLRLARLSRLAQGGTAGAYPGGGVSTASSPHARLDPDIRVFG